MSIDHIRSKKAPALQHSLGHPLILLRVPHSRAAIIDYIDIQLRVKANWNSLRDMSNATVLRWGQGPHSEIDLIATLFGWISRETKRKRLIACLAISPSRDVESSGLNGRPAIIGR